MKFVFPFEVLLKHKIRLEEMAAKALVEAQIVADASRRKLDDLYQQTEDTRTRVLELEKQGGQTSAFMIQADEFINGQKVRIQRQREVIREHLHDVETKQEALIEAAREKKTLVKLKEKQLAEFKVRMNRIEMKETDDLVTMRHRHKSEG